jgi:hypothetical protein
MLVLRLNQYNDGFFHVVAEDYSVLIFDPFHLLFFSSSGSILLIQNRIDSGNVLSGFSHLMNIARINTILNEKNRTTATEK